MEKSPPLSINLLTMTLSHRHFLKIPFHQWQATRPPLPLLMFPLGAYYGPLYIHTKPSSSIICMLQMSRATSK